MRLITSRLAALERRRRRAGMDGGPDATALLHWQAAKLSAETGVPVADLIAAGAAFERQWSAELDRIERRSGGDLRQMTRGYARLLGLNTNEVNELIAEATRIAREQEQEDWYG